MNTEAQPDHDGGAVSDDVRADVAAAFASLKDDAPDTTEQAAAAAVDDTAKADRLRNERGQFAKADDTAVAEPANTVSDADPAQVTPVQPSPAVEAPKSWSAEAKAEWSKLSPALQQAVLKREGEINDGGARWSEEKRRYEEVLTPLRAAAQRSGVDERTGLNQLLAANDFLERDPRSAIQWLAQAYGVDLSKPADNPSPKPPADPMVVQLHQKVSTLESSLAERQRQDTEAQINAFRSASGHEHFDAVKQTMGRLILAGEASDMQDAYDKAVWAVPTIRSQLIAAQTASEAAAKQAREKEAAEKARRGAISVNGSPANAVQVQKQDYETVEDAVRAAFSQHRATA